MCRAKDLLESILSSPDPTRRVWIQTFASLRQMTGQDLRALAQSEEAQERLFFQPAYLSMLRHCQGVSVRMPRLYTIRRTTRRRI